MLYDSSADPPRFNPRQISRSLRGICVRSNWTRAPLCDASESLQRPQVANVGNENFTLINLSRIKVWEMLNFLDQIFQLCSSVLNFFTCSSAALV